MKVREPVRIRDFVITENNWVCAVVSYDNEPKVRAFLRYIPDRNGARVNEYGVRFRKVGFAEARQLMRRSVHFRDGLCAIPYDDIAQLRRPQQCVEQCHDADVATIVDFFESNGVSRRYMGVTGSRLVGLATDSSDIDFVLYGRPSFERGRAALRNAVESGSLPEISTDMWERIFRKRTPELTFEEFVLHEKRKWNRGSIGTTYFDVLFVRDYDEIAIEPRGMDDGFATIRATVTDATYAFDSPAIYEVQHESVNKVLSYTHTYAGQAQEGEVIEARGICNKAGRTRLIVGTSRAAQGEWIKSCSLLSRRATAPNSASR